MLTRTLAAAIAAVMLFGGIAFAQEPQAAPQTSVGQATPPGGAGQEAPDSATEATAPTGSLASIPASPTILSPADGSRTRYYTIDIKVGISLDTTRVTLRKPGSLVASAAPSGLTEVVFHNVRLHRGWNKFFAVAANANGSSTSPHVDIKCVPRIQSLRVSGIFYKRVFNGPRPSLAGTTDGNADRIVVWIGGHKVRTISVAGKRKFTLWKLPLRYGANRIVVDAVNDAYRRRINTIVYRLDIRPAWPTMIVVDKSERRLYYIRGRRLVVRYPVAIGKPSTPTPERVWRIDSKEFSDPSSAYGPRKLRLFARHRSGRRYWYEHTGYMIHGTDTPSSIGHMASHGCIRNYNRNIRKLFNMVRLHTMVLTRR